MGKIIDLFKGRDGVYREEAEVPLRERVEQNQIERSRVWGANNHKSNLKDVHISEAEKYQTAFYDSMSMSSE